MRAFEVLAVSSVLMLGTDAHGAMSFPPSRNMVNTYACGHCANGPSVCGSGSGGQWLANDQQASARDGVYVTPKTKLIAGGMFDVEIFFTTPHMGHMVMELCAHPGATITNDCFVRLHRDPTDTRYAPYLPEHPDILPFPDNGCCNTLNQAAPLKGRFIIPQEAISEHAILRWHWQTGNSCDSHPSLFRNTASPLVTGWSNTINGRQCSTAITGIWVSCGFDCPTTSCAGEQFRNCADVTVVTGDTNQVVTSGNATSEPGNGSDGSGGETNPGPGPGVGPTSNPGAGVLPDSNWTEADVENCQAKVRGTVPDWDEYCRATCVDYTMKGSHGNIFCAQNGIEELHRCVVTLQQACV